jgi:hypothetical protein
VECHSIAEELLNSELLSERFKNLKDGHEKYTVDIRVDLGLDLFKNEALFRTDVEISPDLRLARCSVCWTKVSCWTRHCIKQLTSIRDYSGDLRDIGSTLSQNFKKKSRLYIETASCLYSTSIYVV